MDKIGLNYDFENLTTEGFLNFLRELQSGDGYQWPNLYFAWEKDDGSLFMVGTKSTQMYHMIVRECDPDSFQNRSRAQFGLAPEYSSMLYCINPRFGYMRNNQPYDPVEELVGKVAECKYVGYWLDPDLLMDDPYRFSRTLACGRFELAKEKIFAEHKELVHSVDALVGNATQRSCGLEGFGTRKEERGIRDGVIK